MPQISDWQGGFLRGTTSDSISQEGKCYPQHETPVQQTNLKLALEVMLTGSTKSKWQKSQLLLCISHFGFLGFFCLVGLDLVFFGGWGEQRCFNPRETDYNSRYGAN